MCCIDQKLTHQHFSWCTSRSRCSCLKIYLACKWRTNQKTGIRDMHICQIHSYQPPFNVFIQSFSCFCVVFFYWFLKKDNAHFCVHFSNGIDCLHALSKVYLLAFSNRCFLICTGWIYQIWSPQIWNVYTCTYILLRNFGGRKERTQHTATNYG